MMLSHALPLFATVDAIKPLLRGQLLNISVRSGSFFITRGLISIYALCGKKTTT
jgi:hypothetical protein